MTTPLSHGDRTTGRRTPHQWARAARMRLVCGVSLCLMAMLGLGGCEGETGEERCPDIEPVPATPVAVVDIAGVDPIAVESRSLFGGEARYAPAGEERAVAAEELLLAVTPIAVPAATNGTRSRPTPRLSCGEPPGPSVATSVRLTDVTLTSDARWDAFRPAGSALDGNVIEASSELPSSIDELPGRLDAVRSGAVLRYRLSDTRPTPRLAEYLRGEPTVPLVLLVRLDPPDAERSHRFTVTYRTADGETFTASSVPVTVTPERRPPSVDALAGTAWRLNGYSARAADGILVANTPDDDIGGIEFDGLAGQMVVAVGKASDLGVCEFNIRVADGTLELRGDNPTEPYDPTRRDCFVGVGEPTDVQRFVERFLKEASFQLAIDAEAQLTITAPNGEQLSFAEAS